MDFYRRQENGGADDEISSGDNKFMTSLRTRTTGEKHRVTLFLLYTGIAHIGVMGMLDVVLNFYFVSLGYDVGMIALFQSLPRVGGLVTSVPVGLLTNRVGTYRVVLYSTLALGAGFAMLVSFPSLPLLALSRFLTGFLYGAQQIAISPFMAALVQKEFRTRFFAYHNVVALAATSLGSILGGALPALMVTVLAGIVPPEWVASATTPFAYGVTILLAVTINTLSVIPFLLLKTPDIHQPIAPVTDKTKRIGVPWLFLALLNFPLILFGFTGGLTFPFYNLFFRTQFHVNDATVGTILSIGWMGMGIVPLLNPWWEKHFGRVWALGITMTIAAAAFMGLALSPVLMLAIPSFVLAVSFRNVMQTLFQPLMMDYLPVELHNMTTSVGMVLWNIGWMTASAISGFLQQTIGYGAIMQIVSFGMLLAGISTVVIFRHRHSSFAEKVQSDYGP